MNRTTISTAFGSFFVLFSILSTAFADNVKITNSPNISEQFFVAVENQDIQSVISLLRGTKRIDINMKDENGMTPLMCTALKGNFRIANLLIKNGANVNAKDNADGTALIYAALLGQIKVAKLLIDNNADIEAKHKNGMTAKMMANRYNHYDVAQLLNGKKVSRDRKKFSVALMPTYSKELEGNNTIRIKNFNDFTVHVGLRFKEKGKDFNIFPFGVKTVHVPDGDYDIYFVYSAQPDALYRGDSFSLKNNGIEIEITKVVNGNYSIDRVK